MLQLEKEAVRQGRRIHVKQSKLPIALYTGFNVSPPNQKPRQACRGLRTSFQFHFFSLFIQFELFLSLPHLPYVLRTVSLRLFSDVSVVRVRVSYVRSTCVTEVAAAAAAARMCMQRQQQWEKKEGKRVGSREQRWYPSSLASTQLDLARSKPSSIAIGCSQKANLFSLFSTSHLAIAIASFLAC